MITFEEAGRLLGLAAARDQRIVGDADILAWHSDLNAAGVSCQDAEAALTRFYAVEMAGLEPEDRRRVTTPDVIGIARKIRNERLANFVYEPPPGDDDPNYLARLRGQLEATASGCRPVLSEQPALEGGPHPNVAKILAGVGQPVPDEADEATSVRRPGPLGIECAKCSAAIGRPCRTPGGKERAPHPVRTGEASDPALEQAEMERRRAASARHLARQAEDESPVDEGAAS
ncbi:MULTISPECIES: hypothetical protein [unclassified Streptomyces]|uniref:zinc finger domain-containing protein n=1 Tax=unclassified Streptomyces TaxID=2593676 RepID=UPI001368730F|nr:MULTISPECIES: hypothetical protein [unclassified Streptomyces]NEA03688.1 hypothetical protein [Streptomyces sp. SID10116]MYY79706.1 hypothetical protein [Streptomyces sp. SID335]MYZ12820.1 hypothetical protein [Streptomyces sp. SID337]NDZ91124.1 hypothetical protein [Streptomyces sp. SID10115]NEB43521.1 hypothetical protein [Streptomyces sp. SID339]